MSNSEANILVCNCQRTMQIDGAALGRALGREPLTVHTALCRSQMDCFERAATLGGRLLVACTQEAPLFADVSADNHLPAALEFTNIRERAGWSTAKDARDIGNVQAKIAALIAEARHVSEPAGLLKLSSAGKCLLYGAGQAALDAAHELSRHLEVTLLLAGTDDAQLPTTGHVPVASGSIRNVRGHLGAFEVEVDTYAPALPSSRRRLEFEPAYGRVTFTCDVVVDLTGGPPLVSDLRRDGYLRADPASPVAVAKALLASADLSGEFEKPIYVRYDEAICAHARSHKVGCTRCLDVCPAGAISESGDHVSIDAAICGGCGTCTAVCPTGAVAYAYPRRADLVARARIMLETYRKAGGVHPVVLVHDKAHGMPLIAAMARYGRGLPGHVLPLELNSIAALGHDLMVAVLALGAECIVVLASPEKPEEAEPLNAQVGLTTSILAGLGYEVDRVLVTSERDPDEVERLLHGLQPVQAARPHSFSSVAGKRELARIAFAKLWEGASVRPDRIEMPPGSPYGRINVRVEGCTLCLACVGACPAGALSDSPDQPELSFTEAACVQCGICVATCPEKVITLEPRYDFTVAALTPRVLHREEPFCCIRCSKPFAAPSAIARVTARLQGHGMFQRSDQLALVQMCDTCRIEAIASNADNPMRAGERPRVRTTDDYLAGEADAKPRGREPGDYLS